MTTLPALSGWEIRRKATDGVLSEMTRKIAFNCFFGVTFLFSSGYQPY